MVGLGFLANAMLLVLGSEFLGVLTILQVDWEANPAKTPFKTTRVFRLEDSNDREFVSW